MALYMYGSKTLHWTHHAWDKMRFYRLSEARVKRVLNSPKRIEEGVAPDTIAMMQPASLRGFGKVQKWTKEIWVMIQIKKPSQRVNLKKGEEITVISAWRFPGVTKPRDEVVSSLIRTAYHEYLENK